MPAANISFEKIRKKLPQLVPTFLEMKHKLTQKNVFTCVHFEISFSLTHPFCKVPGSKLHYPSNGGDEKTHQLKAI